MIAFNKGVHALRHLSISFVGGSLFFASSCSHERREDFLEVRQYHLKTSQVVGYQSAMARGEELYRLKGAISVKERQARLGYYYTVKWKNSHVGRGDLKVVMEYQQEGTASKMLKMVKHLPNNKKSGIFEFRIIGESYRRGGQVLIWRIQLLRNDRVVAQKQSYLWR